MISRFLILTAVLTVSIATITACVSNKSDAVTSPEGGAAHNATATTNKQSAENKAIENKPAEPEPIKTIKIFDGRDQDGSERKLTKASASEAALIEKEVSVRAKEEFMMRRMGDTEPNFFPESFGIVSVVEGAFTKPNSKQKAFFYKYSQTNGVVIVENDENVGHYSGDPGDYALYFYIKALPDINQNGLSEIMLLRNTEDSEDTSAYLFELKKTDLELLGEAALTGNKELAGNKWESVSYLVTVQPAANPVFFREMYKKNGAKWTLVKKSEKFSLKKDIDAKLTRID